MARELRHSKTMNNFCAKLCHCAFAFMPLLGCGSSSEAAPAAASDGGMGTNAISENASDEAAGQAKTTGGRGSIGVEPATSSERSTGTTQTRNSAGGNNATTSTSGTSPRATDPGGVGGSSGTHAGGTPSGGTNSAGMSSDLTNSAGTSAGGTLAVGTSSPSVSSCPATERLATGPCSGGATCRYYYTQTCSDGSEATSSNDYQCKYNYWTRGTSRDSFCPSSR